jgi:hypothetical protein
MNSITMTLEDIISEENPLFVKEIHCNFDAARIKTPTFIRQLFDASRRDLPFTEIKLNQKTQRKS